MHIFDNLWFDLSGITFIDFGSHYKSYQIVNGLQNTYTLYNKAVGLDKYGFAIIFSQGRDLVKQKWTVKSLNNVLGLIGGYTALLWMVITFVLSGYETHQFRSSLIKSIFLRVPEEDENSSKTDNEYTDDRKRLLRKRLGSKEEPNFSYC